MSKVAHYLQEHLVGEVMASTDARRYFATDASIFQIPPAIIVYPRNENDVRKTARFTWQLAERGRVIPMTARGSGTDQTGAALGTGIMIVFPAHMNRILELDTKGQTVVIEPGINYGKLQQTLHTHGRFLPPAPASLEYSTVGGAIANNASGDRSFKYGDTRAYVKSLRVVLANGEVIDTGRLSKRELNKKLGLATFEGEVYRSIDTLLEEHKDDIAKLRRNVTKNNAGYFMQDIKRKDGSFDLTPLFVGSQGTLGIITEAVLKTEPHSPIGSVVLATFTSIEQAHACITELAKQTDGACSIELIDGNVIEQANALNPNLLKVALPGPAPALALLVQFDGTDRRIKKQLKRAQKIFEKLASGVQVAADPEHEQQLLKVRDASSTVLAHNEGLLRAVPVIDDGAVPLDQLRTLVENIYQLYERNGLKPSLWGHAGDANLHTEPRLNLGQVGDRQRLFRMMDEYYKLLISLGGTISAESGDGRLRTPYLEHQYGTELYNMLHKVKQIFDPHGTLNPGVKFGTSLEDMKNIIRPDYSQDHFYDHLPRS